LFGGNSNWRGPIWLPVNYLVIEALERYHHFYGDYVQVECPTGSGQYMNLFDASQVLRRRLAKLFLPDASGRRACHGDDQRYASDPYWYNFPLFYEYFHGDTGHGIGASHQTGWTALVATILRDRRTTAGDTDNFAPTETGVAPHSTDTQIHEGRELVQF
jgi:Glycosyl hydrolase family 63 C-terminal domain